MADFNIDNLTKQVILGVIEEWQKGWRPSCETSWFSMTRQMFKNYPAIDVFNQVEMALEEASDEQWFENKYPKEVFEEMTFVIKKPRKEREIVVNGSGITAKITEKISIIDIAEQFGIKVKGNKSICPFHNDTDPSLSFNDSKGWFYCFGCHAKGNIIKFYAMLKELNPNFKYHKPEETQK